MSPTPGRSILITSAPNQARSWVQVGPDCTWVKSRMRTPSSALPAAPHGEVVGSGRCLLFPFVWPFDFTLPPASRRTVAVTLEATAAMPPATAAPAATPPAMRLPVRLREDFAAVFLAGAVADRFAVDFLRGAGAALLRLALDLLRVAIAVSFYIPSAPLMPRTR